ncbi:hypothetical protein HDV62DRAFT_322868 [Trichoderma sp. SZMC 28011]
MDGGMETSSWPAQQPFYSPSIGPTAALSARFAALELSLFLWIGGAFARPHSIDCTPTQYKHVLRSSVRLCIRTCTCACTAAGTCTPHPPQRFPINLAQTKPNQTNSNQPVLT